MRANLHFQKQQQQINYAVPVSLLKGSGGFFFLACGDFGRMFDDSFPCSLRFSFLKQRLARAHLFHYHVRQDQSTVAETTVAECSPDKLLVSSFQDGFPHYAWTAA